MTGTGRRQTWRVSKAAVRGRGGLVAAQHADAARIGAEVLAGGGNAVDAAIATSLAIGVVEPWMSGLGGGGVMVMAPGDGAPPAVIDFTMKAPAALDPADYPLTGGRDVDMSFHIDPECKPRDAVPSLSAHARIGGASESAEAVG